MSPSSPILRVALNLRIPTLFDYRMPEDLKPIPCPGVRVRVPFRTQERTGLVVEVVSRSDLTRTQLKPIHRILDEEPLLPPREMALIRWAAAYYQYPLGAALFTALPAFLRGAKPVPELNQPGWRLTPFGRQAPLEDLARAPKQRRVVALLRDSPAGLATTVIREKVGTCAASLKRLEATGWIASHAIPASEKPPRIAAAPPFALNPDQNRAVQAVRGAFGGFQSFLLDGVTGSGKTEVYIQLLLAAVKAGKQALILVPEIGLTPQLQRRLSERVGGRLVVLHSGLSPRERLRGWRRAAMGEVDLVLGTRSAIFTPLPRLGLILVDEEHDLSFKQQEGFRYSARDLAVIRAQRTGCPVLLGSATPSLESLHNARTGRYGWLRLPRRVGTAREPEIRLVDMRGQSGNLSPALLAGMREELGRGGQVLLFLNRRGYASVLWCRGCGWTSACPQCDAPLTFHLADHRLWCHHCGRSQGIPSACPRCGHLDIRSLGRGTEGLESEVQALFPDVPIARIDRDSTRSRGSLDRLLAAIRAGRYPLLIGTQMLAKGHHFPRVALVGILNVDQHLYSADFRASERLAQLIIQVAGRAGRGQRAGRVFLQTQHPHHPLLDQLQTAGYPAFAAAALAEREEARLPPYGVQALLRAEAPRRGDALNYLQDALAQARDEDREAIHLFGPMPAPMEKRAGRYRAQILIEAQHRRRLQAFLHSWIPRLDSLKKIGGVRWSLDVDPQEMG